MSGFFDQRAATNYLDGPPRKVPGYDGLLRMTMLLLAERLKEASRVLVLGAGGGLEIKAMAENQPTWRFDGVDPSGPMLQLARQTTHAHAERIELHEGYINAAPAGPFDGATCILTLHFVPLDERLQTLKEVHRRLRPGAPFVLAHLSFPQQEPARSNWIARHIRYGAPGHVPESELRTAQQSIGRLPILSPEHEEAMLREAGFANITPFYMAFSFRGWVAYAQ